MIRWQKRTNIALEFTQGGTWRARLWRRDINALQLNWQLSIVFRLQYVSIDGIHIHTFRLHHSWIKFFLSVFFFFSSVSRFDFCRLPARACGVCVWIEKRNGKYWLAVIFNGTIFNSIHWPTDRMGIYTFTATGDSIDLKIFYFEKENKTTWYT